MKADGAQKTRRVVIGLALVVVFALLAKWMSPAEEVPAVADRSPPSPSRPVSSSVVPGRMAAPAGRLAVPGETDEGRSKAEEVWLVAAPIPPMAVGDFLAALRAAVAANLDSAGIQELLERVLPEPEWVAALTALADDPAAGRVLRGYAAEALVRTGTPAAMHYVLDELIEASRAHDAHRSDQLVAALEAPTKAGGLRLLFDLLLKQGAYADFEGDLPADVLAAARKALLAAPDREAVGILAAELYLDPRVMANRAAMWELFDGVSHPLMLSRLVARAYAENLPDNAAQIMARLGQSDEQGVVQAFAQLALSPSVPVDALAEALYQWSQAHPADALPGLFLEYLTDSTLAPDQRTVAAYGLAGTADPEFARTALEKALANEMDPAVRMDLQTALALLEE